MIYEKNGAAYPAHKKSNRYSQVFEYMFVLSKGTPKTANLLKDKKNKWGGHKSFGTQTERQADGALKQRKNNVVQEYGYRDNIWRYNNGKGYGTKDEVAFKHPAIFPDQLAFDHIYSFSNENDIVYDCFGGSGTVAKSAILLKRNWIMSEISKEYCDIAEKRINPYLPQNNLF